MLNIDNIYKGDCMDLMRDIDDQSVDAIICDLPYGTTPCEWDKALPMDALWAEYKRIIKPNGSIVLFCQQPFTTKLIASNMDMWKYNWIWVKDNGTNFLNSHYQPLKTTEDIAVFGFAAAAPTKGMSMTYNPQINIDMGKSYVRRAGNRSRTSVVRNMKGTNDKDRVNDGSRYPTNILCFTRDKERIHPTQKPVDLLRYLVLTHTNEGDLVLDNCMGVGSTIIACIREKRHYIGMELDDKWFGIAENRICNEKNHPKLF